MTACELWRTCRARAIMLLVLSWEGGSRALAALLIGVGLLGQQGCCASPDCAEEGGSSCARVPASDNVCQVLGDDELVLVQATSAARSADCQSSAFVCIEGEFTIVEVVRGDARVGESYWYELDIQPAAPHFFGAFPDCRWRTPDPDKVIPLDDESFVGSRWWVSAVGIIWADGEVDCVSTTCQEGATYESSELEAAARADECDLRPGGGWPRP